MKRRFLVFFFATIELPVFFIIAIFMRLLRLVERDVSEYKVFWGTEPLLNSHYWADATQTIFSQSIFAIRHPSRILSEEKADLVIFNQQEPHHLLPRIIFHIRENIKFTVFTFRILRNASLLCYSCEGFLFQYYTIWGFSYRVEFFLWKIAGIKVAIFPYGYDSYVYSKVANRDWLYGLLTDYPDAAKNQDFIDRRLKFFIRRADLFLPGSAMFDGMGRSDWITPSTLCIDTTYWSPIENKQSRIFTVSHAPNHRAVKGTKYVIDAIEMLKESGHLVTLRLIENVDNQEVQKILATESDLHVDQLFADGYGLNALESMSLGIPTISNFQGATRDFFDRWTFTKDCPIVVCSETELAQTIRSLMNNKEELREIGRLSREYVLSHHSYHSFSKNFHNALVTRDQRYAKFSRLHGKEIKSA